MELKFSQTAEFDGGGSFVGFQQLFLRGHGEGPIGEGAGESNAIGKGGLEIGITFEESREMLIDSGFISLFECAEQRQCNVPSCAVGSWAQNGAGC